MSGDGESESTMLESCPRCESPVAIVTTIGPAYHVLSPCGCRVWDCGL